jgi:hypothetical protein
MQVAVVVPYKNILGERRTNWEFTRGWWERLGYPVFTAPGPPGLFNRSAARNQAAALAEPWDVAIFADADTVGQPELIAPAIDLAAAGHLAYPHTMFAGLSHHGTTNFIKGREPVEVEKRKSLVPGGILAIGHDLFQRVHGWDEGFVGWGYEDLAFAWAAATFGGERRLAGTITHLWHWPAAEKRAAIQRQTNNAARKDRYHAAAGDPAAMTALLEELHVHHLAGA